MRISGESADTTLDLLRAFGLQIIESPHLTSKVTYIPGRNLALVRAGLTPDERAEVGEQLLMQVVCMAAASATPRADGNDGSVAAML